jgi:type II secretory pathway pseudopilin PulG
MNRADICRGRPVIAPVPLMSKMHSYALRPNLCRCAAFTLLELLLVVGVLGLVAVMAVPGSAGTRERNKRIACLNNLRAMGAASQMYAQDDSKGRLTGTLKSTPVTMQADDDLNWLHGFGTNFPKGYIDDLNTFCCPATRNRVRPDVRYQTLYNGSVITKLLDLDNNTIGNMATNGHSYEMESCWKNLPNYTRRTTRTVLSYRHEKGTLAGTVTGPSQTFIFFDGMEPHSAQGWPWEDWPNPYDGHGQDGGNVGFADGHCEWIGKASWNYRYELSADNGRQLTPYN